MRSFVVMVAFGEAVAKQQALQHADVLPHFIVALSFKILKTAK